MYPDFTFTEYGNAGGELERSDYANAAPLGVAIVQDEVGFNAVETEHTRAAYFEACKLAVDICAAFGAENGANLGAGGFSLGAFSVSGSNTTAGGKDELTEQVRRVIRPVLFRAGLLFKGLD